VPDECTPRGARSSSSTHAAAASSSVQRRNGIHVQAGHVRASVCTRKLFRRVRGPHLALALVEAPLDGEVGESAERNARHCDARALLRDPVLALAPPRGTSDARDTRAPRTGRSTRHQLLHPLATTLTVASATTCMAPYRGYSTFFFSVWENADHDSSCRICAGSEPHVCQHSAGAQRPARRGHAGP
jgi:hypothetical protein